MRISNYILTILLLIFLVNCDKNTKKIKYSVKGDNVVDIEYFDKAGANREVNNYDLGNGNWSKSFETINDNIGHLEVEYGRGNRSMIYGKIIIDNELTASDSSVDHINLYE